MADIESCVDEVIQKRADGQSVPDMIRAYQASIPNYVIYDGIPFPGCLLTKRISHIKDFRIRPDDVIICGYPRSGGLYLVAAVILVVTATNIAVTAVKIVGTAA